MLQGRSSGPVVKHDVTVSDLANRRVLVTGASGFIGSHVVARLVASGAEVFAVSSSVSATAPERLVPFMEQIEILEANLTDRSSLAHVIARAQPELIIHLGAFTHVGKSFSRIDENIQTNVQGTVNLLLALQGRYERFVYISSGDVYGDAPVPFSEDGPVSPASPYAVSKYAAERFCRMFQDAYGWPIVCLRPFNVYGPRQSTDRIIPELITSALQGRDLKMTAGLQTREFMYVDDVADVFVRALVQSGIDGQVINITRAEEISIHDLALSVLELMGNPVKALFGALDTRPNEIWRMFGDDSKARDLLGWTPTTSLQDGLARTIDWYRAQVG
jgi:nucleoside-diphosphate-sugar epimerase